MKKPEVYLDMDGVLADFFTEYAKLAGIESGNYRDIPPAKTDPTLQKMVGTDFFARLPKLRNADQLVSMIVKLYGHYHICSSPLRGDYENSEAQKKVWIQKHLNPQPKDIVITPNKAKWAKQADGTPNILIDDRGSNISAWEAAGGVGIKYQADEDGLDVIVNGLTRARKIMKGEEEHKPQELKSVDRSSGKLIAKSGDNDDEKLTPADVNKEAYSQAAADAKKIRDKKAGRIGQGIGWKDYDNTDELANDIADRLMSITNSVKMFDMKRDESVYRFIENYFIKYGYPTKVFKAVAKIVFDKLAQDGRKSSMAAKPARPRFPRLSNESASAGATGSGSIASSTAQGGGWLFGGTVGAPKGAKKKKAKVIKR
jgi:5'-nucleotidase